MCVSSSLDRPAEDNGIAQIGYWIFSCLSVRRTRSSQGPRLSTLPQLLLIT